MLQTILSLCCLVWGLLLGPPAIAQDAIVNRDVAERSVSQSSLRAIFSMHMSQWPDGRPIRVFVLPSDDPGHVAFAKNVLHVFPHQLKRSWDVLVYSGSGQAPTEVSSPEEMLKKVSSTPGAIGYLPEDYLIAGGRNENVHVLAVR